MVKDNLIKKGFILFVGGCFAGVFVDSIFEAISNFSFGWKFFVMVFYWGFIIVDVVNYIKFGEELIYSFWEWIQDVINDFWECIDERF